MAQTIEQMIGIYGGTFDPIHVGHLRTALEVRESLALDELRLLPCGMPAHRDQPLASPCQRRQMIEIALADGEPGISLDDRELQREGPSFMVDTLVSLRSEVSSTTAFCLILGADAFGGFSRWSRWEAIFELAHVIVMGRPETSHDRLPDELERQKQQRLVTDAEALRFSVSGHIYFVQVTQLAISASRIRSLIGSGKSVRYLLPDAVSDFICSQQLYC